MATKEPKQDDGASTAAPSSEAQRDAGPKLGVIGGIRWFWRQLTSMRTALFLLLLVAVAAVPGSIFPQHSIDESRVTQYEADHTTIAPWLSRLGFFNVYSSPWFAAIYLLLAVSLIGCILPRTKIHWRAMRSGPPAMPRNISRLPAHETATIAASPEAVEKAARKVLRGRRFRLRKGLAAGEVASESGMLRETGNLLFHLSMVGIIVSVAAGHLWGWRGDVIVSDGHTLSSTLTRYDTLSKGPLVDEDKDIPSWSLKLNHLKVTFEDKVPSSSPQWGQPRDFSASVNYKQSPTSKWQHDNLKVNHPLSVGGGEVYLLGNGYSPKITYRDARGNVLYDEATPFLTVDNKYKSTGAFKVTGASPNQVGLFGFFLPTAYVDPQLGPSSAYPDLENPALLLGVYTGDLYPNGRPQSVFSLDTSSMKQVKDSKGQPVRLTIGLGQTVKLPNNLGSVTFDSVPRWAGLSIRHDPGKDPALFFALLALGGLVLSLTIRRRRVFARVLGPDPDAETTTGPRTVVEIGGLAKGEDPRLGLAVEDLLRRIRVAAEGNDKHAGDAR